MNEENYEDLRPVSGEEKYLDFSEEADCWGIFGEESGFCYSLHSSKHEAEENLFYQP